jgi:hypothetical protein
MWIMALCAVAHRRGVNYPLNVSSFLIGMAGDTEGNRARGDELYPCDIFLNPNLMTTGTAHGNRRMDRLALRFVFMALRAGCGILLGIKGNRMYGRAGPY